MVGNLLGDPLQNVAIGADFEGVFEHHADSDPAYSLLGFPQGSGELHEGCIDRFEHM